MTISSTVIRNDYVGNGAVDTYSYSFKITDEAHLRVVVRDTDGVETELVLTTDYTVTGVNEASGGTIVLVDNSQDWIDAGGDLETGYAISIISDVPLLQGTDIANQGRFYARVHEAVFDRLTRIAQQLNESLARSLKLPDTIAPTAFDPTLPATLLDNAGAVIQVNADGDGLVLSTATIPDATVTAYMETLLDDASAGAARTTLGIDGASGVIATGDLANLSVTAEKLAADAVTTAKILDLNVTAGKLAPDSVITAKILDANVTPAKMAANGIQLMVSTGAGHGSTNTKIRRIETAVVSAGGSSISATHSAANGTSFTIGVTGLYALTYEDTVSSGDIGISVNSNQLTTSIASITAAHRVAYAAAAVDTTAAITAIRWLTAGDVVRPHTNGVAASVAATVSFTITRIL